MSMTFRFALMCLLPLFPLAGCSNASFHQEKNNSIQRPDAHGDQAKQSPHLNKKTQLPGFAELDEDVPGETESALPPHQVSGSWLACVPVSHSQDEELIGCAIVRAGRKQKFSKGAMTWYVTGQDGSPQPFEVKNAPALDPWHVTLRSPQTFANAQVRVELKEEARKMRTFTTTIGNSDQQTAETNADQAYHVGDGSFSASSCAADLANVPASGQTFQAEVETEQAGPWLLTLSGLCGVDDRAMARIVVVTELGTTEVLNEGKETSIAVWVPAQAGRWSIAIMAEDRTPGDVEDFLFTNLKVTGASRVSLNVR